MSAYYSKFSLNTYANTPYFESQLPLDYKINLVLQKCKVFHRLPPHIRELSALAKKWAVRKHPDLFGVGSDIERAYDKDGYELDPTTGKRLTDAEVEAQWQPDPSLDKFIVQDIPIPKGGFADPDEWEEPEPKPDEPEPAPSREHLLSVVASHGRERVSKDYGIPLGELPTAAEAKRHRPAIRKTK